jgi:hypothetical protein
VQWHKEQHCLSFCVGKLTSSPSLKLLQSKSFLHKRWTILITTRLHVENTVNDNGPAYASWYAVIKLNKMIKNRC